MSLGFRGEQNRKIMTNAPPASTSTVTVPQVKVHHSRARIEHEESSKAAVSDMLVLHIPSLGACMYTTLSTLLIAAGVSSLWVMAAGMWWIKFYVECNRGLRTEGCPLV